jgi:ribosome recycling factor
MPDDPSTDIVETTELEMDESVAAFRHEVNRLRSGRASTALLEGLQINYYGTKTPLRQLAGLAAPEPRLLIVTPYDKTAMQEIEKAIRTSDLGLNPMNDGKIIRVPIPELNEERRRDLVRQVHKKAEEYRVSVRNHRRQANEKLKQLNKDKQITDDQLRINEAKIQQLTATSIDKLEKILAAKEAEIMEV